MVVTSYEFLLLFLPITLFIYWKSRHKLTILFISSYLFYALGGLIFVPLLLGLSLATYWLAQTRHTGWGIGLNLLALLVFKYLNFGLDTLNTISSNLGVTMLIPLLQFALPLGISFFVFKHIGYLLDIRAGSYEPVRSKLLFVTYSAFFPQISAGPLSISNDTLTQLANLPQTITSGQLYTGAVWITIGLVKKILIADTLASALQLGLYSPDQMGSGLIWAWASVMIFALQLYFDFSSYTDIVLGVSHLLGITLLPNFNNPYLATSPADFWQRWHISLSRWFRFYLFSPLSRTLLKRWGPGHSERAQYTANLVTMGLIGLWHGAGWGFILWGLYHGALLNIYAAAKRRKIKLEGHILLLFSIMVGWALFASPTLPFAAHLFSGMFGLHGLGNAGMIEAYLTPMVVTAVGVAVLMTASGYVEAANLPDLRQALYALVLGILLVMCILHLNDASSFVYTQF